MTQQRSKVILIAEDDRFLAKTLVNELTRDGLEVIHVHNGEQAMGALKGGNISLVVLDLMMPQKNGFEVLTEKKLDSTLKDIPVIVLSNLDQDADREKALKLGAKAYLVKAHNSLQQIVAQVLEHVAMSE
jgi:DNA-binding response OmpR family regulator